MVTGPPDRPLYISEKVVVQFLVAAGGTGVSNEFFTQDVTVQEMFLPALLEPSDMFLYNLTFYASSVLNSASIDVTVRSPQSEGESSLSPIIHCMHTDRHVY